MKLYYYIKHYTSKYKMRHLKIALRYWIRVVTMNPSTVYTLGSEEVGRFKFASIGFKSLYLNRR